MNYRNESLFGYEPVEEAYKTGSQINYRLVPFHGMNTAYVKTSQDGFDLEGVDIYDGSFPLNTKVYSYGAFIDSDASPVHPQDTTTPWSEMHQVEYAFFADRAGNVGHAPNQYSDHLVDKEKIQNIMRQAEVSKIVPIVWFDRDWISPEPRHFGSGDKAHGDYYYLNIIMPMNRALWLNDLWIAEDPWKFLYELKKYPAYGYGSLPTVLQDANGKPIALADLWGNAIRNYMASKGYDAIAAAKHWDKDLLQSTVQFLEQLIRNEMNPQSRKITTELNKVLVGEVVLPAVGIKAGSSKRGYQRIWRSPEKVRKIAFFLSDPEKQKLLAAWDDAVNRYIIGPSSQVSAQLARVIDKSSAPTKADIDEATSRDRITTVPTFNEKGEVVFTTTAQSAAIERMNLPKTFIPKDMPAALPAYYTKGEQLRREMQYDFDPGSAQAGLSLDGKRKGSLLPWLIGGAAAAVAAYTAVR